jgi:hypothetical protein
MVKRWQLHDPEDCACLERSEDGAWVEFSDVHEEIARLNKRIVELENKDPGKPGVKTPVHYEQVRLGGDTETRAKHPSWVMIQISRVTGSKKLFGSQLDHNQFFQMRINQAEAQSSLGGVNYFGHGRGFVEVCFSGSQFVDLITSMNIGSGVPATMTWFNGQYVPQADERSPHPNNEAKKGFMRSVERTTKDLQKNIDEVNELIADNKPLNQAKKKQIRDSLSLISYGFSNNASFYLDRYNEATDQIVTQAKNEVETFITSSLVAKGIESLTNEARVVALPEFTDVSQD